MVELVPATVDDGRAERIDEPPHPIEEAINRFIHRSRDIRRAAGAHVSLAIRVSRRQYEDATKLLDEGRDLLTSADAATRAKAHTQIDAAVRLFERSRYSSLPDVIAAALFISLFSGFDEFTGQLLRALYNRKPELLRSLNRNIPLTDVVAASSLDALVESALDAEVESFRRESYTKQFTSLEESHKLKLRAFAEWAPFVECSQRRHLFTHCGGVVSAQYRKEAIEAGFPAAQLAAVGETLDLRPEYFYAACETVIATGVKLGHTLWRKVLPAELDAADTHLHKVQFGALCIESWKRARTFGEFALSQPRISSDLNRLIALVNYCIALSASGEKEKARKLITDEDLSTALPDFRLARAVILELNVEAASIMRSIGERGELVGESEYHTWPLFRLFRNSTDFLEAYESIYGYPFATRLTKAADEAQASAEAALARSERGEMLALERGAGSLDALEASVRIAIDSSMSLDSASRVNEKGAVVME